MTQNENVRIMFFNSDNQSEYYRLIEKAYKTSDLYSLSNQKFNFEKYIYVMLKEKSDEIIGYCIVENALEHPDEWLPFIFNIYSIPLDVLKVYPYVISDCVISSEYRRNSYGRTLAEYVISAFSKCNMSLYADGDGVYFWEHLGFEWLDKSNSIMILRR